MEVGTWVVRTSQAKEGRAIAPLYLINWWTMISESITFNDDAFQMNLKMSSIADGLPRISRKNKNPQFLDQQ
jgi:hypothetical protein